MKYIIILFILFNFLFANTIIESAKAINDLNITYKIPEEEIISFANAPLPPKSKFKKVSENKIVKKANKKFQSKKETKIIKGISPALVNNSSKTNLVF